MADDANRKKDRPQGQDPSTLREALNRAQSDEGEAMPQRPAAAAETRKAPVPGEETPMWRRSVSLGGPTDLDRAVFCRQFATLIEVGIPVLRSLQILSVRTANPKLKKAIGEAARGVEEGESIHQSLAHNEDVFSSLVVRIVRVGELGGILEQSLRRLAEIMEGKAKIRRQVTRASMYPMVALLVALVVVIVILTQAVPIFAEMYRDLDADLPNSTQFLIGLSNFLTAGWGIFSVWVLLLILLVVAFFALKMWNKTPTGHMFFSTLTLRTPIFRGINKKLSAARCTRTLGGLVSAGIPLVESMGITAETNENAVVTKRLHQVQDRLEQGERMSDHLYDADIFPEIAVDMIAIGEETGTLDQMLERVADIYDAEVDATLDGLASIIEPVLIVVLGGIVLFLALAALVPYFNMASVIGEGTL